jgi:glucose/arabinose dehydrogenase
MRPVRPSLLLGAAALALTACAGSGGGAAPTWEPSPALPTGPGVQVSPIVPGPSGSGGQPGAGGAGGAGGAPARTSPTKPNGRIDPLVVATRLRAPVGLAVLPDGSALVGERTTGRIVRVQPRAGEPVPTVRVLRGLDTSGDGGLLDLAVSPTFAEDGLVYAYVTTPTDNRVIDFTLHGPVTPVFTGIPKGATGNTGRIAFGPDGDLYIGTGDTGHPALAGDPRSLAGKVLRVNEIGDAAQGNPVASSPIFTSGHHVVDGLCPVPRTDIVLEVEAGSPAEINVLHAGSFYGWPPSSNRFAVGPNLVLPPRYNAPGGCAVAANRVWITSLDGRALISAPLRSAALPPGANPYTAVLTNRYGRLKTVVAAPDGSLWLTTSNRDGHGRPVPADERVIHLPPQAAAGRSPL